MASPTADPSVRVSTLELFFDLVFVFTITQLTAALLHRPTLEGLLQVAVMLGVIWWMYGGYAWLTNAVPPNTARRRLLMLGGMGAYLLLALAIPRAFHGSGLTFGLAYLFIVLLHSGLFSTATPGRMITVAPHNAVSALVVLAGGIAGGTAQYVLWTLAVVMEWSTPRISGLRGWYEIAPAHFVERHGLVVIVAIGESIVAIGIGAADLPVDLALAAVAGLGLALSAALWWAYFGGDDERAEQALTAAAPADRPRLAIDGFGYAHLPLLLGIVMIAAAEKKATGHAFDPLGSHYAIGLAAGLALFLAGEAAFRRALDIGRADLRLAAAAAGLLTIPLGTEVAAAAQLGALAALMAGVFELERRHGRPRADSLARA